MTHPMLASAVKAAAAVGVASLIAGDAHAQTSACFTSGIGAAVLSNVRRVVSARGARADTLRSRTQLPSVSDTTAVALVTSDSVCRAAVLGYRKALATVRPTADTAGVTQVVLVRVTPTRYVLFAGGSAGEFLEYQVFDDRFGYVATYLG